MHALTQYKWKQARESEGKWDSHAVKRGHAIACFLGVRHSGAVSRRRLCTLTSSCFSFVPLSALLSLSFLALSLFSFPLFSRSVSHSQWVSDAAGKTRKKERGEKKRRKLSDSWQRQKPLSLSEWVRDSKVLLNEAYRMRAVNNQRCI